ncbi:hypothetical protein Tco_0008549 [Tanacetum coccineum]
MCLNQECLELPPPQQLPHASRNTNPHMSKSSGVIHTTSVSRPQLKCYQVKDKVVPNNSQVKFQKKENSNSKTSKNAKCLFVLKCPISASKPKRKANKSVATPHKKIVASDTTIQKSKSYYKELYENTNQEWKWWIAKRCPSGSNLSNVPSSSNSLADVILIPIPPPPQLLTSGCTKHMTGNLKLLCNFVEKFLAKRSSFKIKAVPSSKGRLNSASHGLCGHKVLQSINGEEVILVMVDDYSIYTWTRFLMIQGWETPNRHEILEPRHSLLISKKKGIEHSTSTPRKHLNRTTLLKDGNRTLVEAARTMLSASKLPLSFWAEQSKSLRKVVATGMPNFRTQVSTAYGVSTSSGYNSQRENSSSYTDELMYSFFANQSNGSHLDHEDLDQLDKFDLEEIDLKWQVA